MLLLAESTSLVHDFWVTIVTLQVSEDVVGVLAAEVAETGLDPQHLPGESRPVWTLKLHVDGLGLVGDAAALVHADTAVFGSVLLLAGAARDGEVRRLIFPVDVQTFLSWLDVFGDVHFTGPQVAEAGLFDQLTLVVGVRDPHGQAAATGL